MRPIDFFAITWFAGLGALSFLVFGYDKWRAARPGRRVPEKYLILLAALGGWLGGFIGMNLFRHKTAKWSFKIRFALALVPFAAEVWAWLHWR